MAIIGGAKSVGEIKQTVTGGFMTVMRVGQSALRPSTRRDFVSPIFTDHMDDLSCCDRFRPEVYPTGGQLARDF